MTQIPLLSLSEEPGDCRFSGGSRLICRDWTTGQPFSALEVRVGRSDSHWHIAAHGEFVPHLHPSSGQGNFVEGLWDYDVVELFIGQRGREEYVEIHLDPSGSWWCAVFAVYRDLARTIPSARPNCRSERSGEGWRVAMTLAGSVLPEWTMEERIEANLAAIVGHDPRQYLTYAAPLPGPADFHSVELRLPVLWVEEV